MHMPNLFERKTKQDLKRKDKDIVSMDIDDGTIKQHHLEANLIGIKVGLVVDLPTTPGTDSHYRGFFATDENKLYLWNNSAWKSVTLS